MRLFKNFKILLAGSIFGLMLFSTANAYTFTRTLTIGLQGEDVVALQNFLIEKGFLSWPTEATKGYFGSLTFNAVKAWQSSVGISPADGYFGVTSKSILNGESSVSVNTTMKITLPAKGDILPIVNRTSDTLSGNEYFTRKIDWNGGSDYTFDDVIDGNILAYLQKNDSSKTVVGKIVPAAYGSILFLSGQVANPNCDMGFPATGNSCYNKTNFKLVEPGKYTIKLIDKRNGAVAESEVFSFEKSKGANSNGLPSAGYTFCAAEGQTCSFTGTKDVIYGANGKWVEKANVDNLIYCGNNPFEKDPIRNVKKACFIKDPEPAKDLVTPIVKSELAKSFDGTWDRTYNIYLSGGTTANPVKKWSLNFDCPNSVREIDAKVGALCQKDYVFGSTHVTGDSSMSLFVNLNDLGTNNVMPFTVKAFDKNGRQIGITNSKITIDGVGSVTTQNVKVTFDSKSFDPKTQSLILSGTATNIPTTGSQPFGLVVASKSGDKIWGSGTLEVKNNKWSINVSDSGFVTGTYTLIAYSNNIEIGRTNIEINFSATQKGIYLYEHINYSGKSYYYDLGSVNKLGTGINDKISSIKIVGDMQIDLYKDFDFKGSTKNLQSSVSDLRTISFNDVLSSFKIKNKVSNEVELNLVVGSETTRVENQSNRLYRQMNINLSGGTDANPVAKWSLKLECSNGITDIEGKGGLDCGDTYITSLNLGTNGDIKIPIDVYLPNGYTEDTWLNYKLNAFNKNGLEIGAKEGKISIQVNVTPGSGAVPTASISINGAKEFKMTPSSALPKVTWSSSNASVYVTKLSPNSESLCKIKNGTEWTLGGKSASGSYTYTTNPASDRIGCDLTFTYTVYKKDGSAATDYFIIKYRNDSPVSTPTTPPVVTPPGSVCQQRAVNPASYLTKTSFSNNETGREVETLRNHLISKGALSNTKGVDECGNAKYDLDLVNALNSYNTKNGINGYGSSLNQLTFSRINAELGYPEKVHPEIPDGYTYCATGGQTCSISGKKDLIFGASGSWITKTALTSSVYCADTTFGDPIKNVRKGCYIKDSVVTPPAPVTPTPAPAAPTASITINGEKEFTMTPGIALPTITWSSTNGSTYSTITNVNSATNCLIPSGTAWTVGGKTASGSYTLKVNDASSRVGCDMTFIYTVKNSSNQTATDSFVLKYRSTPTSLNRTLKVGDEGTDVAIVQETLKKKGFFSGDITGFFGKLTAGAVSAFQQANALEAVGEVGPKTKSLLNSLLGN